MSISEKIIIYNRNKIEDNRGWFLKAMTGKESNLPQSTGEVYLTMASPKQMKGGHYHPEANEWFTLITGECVLKLIDTETDEILDIYLSANNSQTIYVPCGVAHAFFNTSSVDDFILLAYSDQLYDPADTITFAFT